MPIVRAIMKNGKVEIHAEGYSGPACQTATAPFLKRLGVDPRTVQEEILPEFHQGNEQHLEVDQGG